MKSIIKLSSLAVILLIANSCATIVSKSNWPIVVGTSPIGASVSITNKKGLEVYKGTTPAALTLKSGAGFFAKESYKVKISMQGYDEKIIPLECKVNGWYAGNILIGGIIGLLIVDPATGAMYKLSTDAIHEVLAESPVTQTQAMPSLQILNIHEIPQQWRSNLTSIK